MVKIRLEHVKTYHIGEFKSVTDDFGFKYSRAEMLWKTMQHEFKCDENVGIIFYNDGIMETLGCVNFVGGVCDDCKINKENVKKIEMFRLV